MDDSVRLCLYLVSYNKIMHILPPPFFAGYIVSVRRTVIGSSSKSSCWPWQYPGESLTCEYIFHEEHVNIEHARTAYHKTCGTEYQQPYRRFNSQKPYSYYKGNIAQARPTSVSDVSRSLQSWLSTTHWSYSQLTFFQFFFLSDVPRSLQSWVSTIQTVVLTADVFQLFIELIKRRPAYIRTSKYVLCTTGWALRWPRLGGCLGR